MQTDHLTSTLTDLATSGIKPFQKSRGFYCSKGKENTLYFNNFLKQSKKSVEPPRKLLDCTVNEA